MKIIFDPILRAFRMADIPASGFSGPTQDLDPVISQTNTPAVGPASGDRYLVGAAPTGTWSTHANNIAEWDGAAWQYTIPTLDDVVYITNTLTTKRYNGTSWVPYTGTAILQNGNTLGANIVIGANDNKDIQFKSNGVIRGKFGAAGQFNAANNAYFGHISTSAAARVHIKGIGSTSATYAFRVDSATVSSIFTVRNDGETMVRGVLAFGVAGGFPAIQSYGNPLCINDLGNGVVIGKNAGAGTNKLLVYGATADGTTNSAEFLNSASTSLMVIKNDGQVGFGVIPTAVIHAKSLGATSATYPMKLENSTGTCYIKYDSDGYFLLDKGTNGIGLEVRSAYSGNLGDATIKVVGANTPTVSWMTPSGSGSKNWALTKGYNNGSNLEIMYSSAADGNPNSTCWTGLGNTGNSYYSNRTGFGYTTPTARIHIECETNSGIKFLVPSGNADRAAIFLGAGSAGYASEELYFEMVNSSFHFRGSSGASTEYFTITGGSPGNGAARISACYDGTSGANWNSSHFNVQTSNVNDERAFYSLNNSASVSGATTAYAGYFEATGIHTGGTQKNVAGYFVASGAVKNYAAMFDGGINTVNIPTANTGLATGDLYIDTAANILANGDLVVGRKA